jgi:hypothetical protein
MSKKDGENAINDDRIGRVLVRLHRAGETITQITNILKGTVHGKTIELEQDSGLPDGQTVSVTLFAASAPGEGLRRSFGAWADDSVELDGFL